MSVDKAIGLRVGPHRIDGSVARGERLWYPPLLLADDYWELLSQLESWRGVTN
jgi:hypothetical protein